MNCTILGLKIETCPRVEDAAGKALRTLVDMALDAANSALQRDLVVSIGPTGSLLLGHLHEVNADRALKLAEAIAAMSLEPGYAGVKWPIAGVITQGQVTKVNVLEHSHNLEGLPAIAASRILTKIGFGQLAIASGVVCDNPVKKALGKLRPIVGKRKGESYEIRISRQIEFYKRKRARRAPKARLEKASVPTTSLAAPANTLEELSTPTCRRLRIEAFSEHELPPRVHELHELQIPAAVGEFAIPIALCAPLDKPTAADVRIDGRPFVFDDAGLLEAKVLPASSPDWRIRIVIPADDKRTSSRRVVNIVYRPLSLRGRISIRMPADGYHIQRALVILWGTRKQLDTSALTIGTEQGGGRYPIVAGCFELATNPYALAWDIERFEAGFVHEISWADTWKPTSHASS